MKISKGLAIFISVLFFFGIVGLFLFIFLSLFQGFSFSENPIIRIVSLLIIIGITQGFYNYLRK
jgi:hypothetical protein